MIKEKTLHYKFDENKFCDACGVSVGDCTEYIGKIYCVGCWAELDALVLSRPLSELITKLKETMSNVKNSEVVVNYSDAEAFLHFLEEYSYIKELGYDYEEEKPSKEGMTKKVFGGVSVEELISEAEEFVRKKTPEEIKESKEKLRYRKRNFNHRI